MILRRVGVLMGILLVLTTIFVIIDVNCVKYNTTPLPREEILRPRQLNISESSIFMYRAYARRFRNQNYSTLEILTINQCLPRNLSISAKVGSTQLELTSYPVEGSCPWTWAAGCQLNAHIFYAEIPTKKVESEISIHSSKMTVSMPLIRWAEERLIPGTTICVPPLYWYTDWTKLLLFLEWWKAEGVTEIIIYYCSSTNTVEKMLEHYIRQDFVKLVEWPLLPSTSEYDPNNSVYRLSHSLAHNDCLRRIRTEYGMLIDIDEIIVPRFNIPILTLIDGYFSSDRSLGSLSFQHVHVMFSPPLVPKSDFKFEGLDYRGIGNVSFGESKGPPKITFRTSAIRRLQTHSVGEFVSEKYRTQEIPKTEAVLLHNRYTNVILSNEQMQEIRIADPPILESFRVRLVAAKNDIYPGGAYFDRDTQGALGACLAKWRTEQKNCKNPVLGCSAEMRQRENWTSVAGEKSFEEYTVFNL